MSRNHKIIVLILAWIFFAGVFVRVWNLWDYWMSPDEAMTLYVSGASSLEVMYDRSLEQAHPPTYFLLLKLLMGLSSNVFFLKTILSLVPGVCTIIVFYFLGREVTGKAGSIFMSYLAAFGFGPIILSQVIRSYSLVVACLSAALLFYLRSKNKSRKNYIFYMLFILVAVSLHYSSLLVLAAVSGAWFLRLLIEKKSGRDYARFIILHMPVLAMVLLFYHYHFSKIFLLYKSWLSGYLSSYLYESPGDLLYGAYTLFHYCFYRPFSPFFAVLSIAGFYALFKRSRDLLLITILLLFLNGSLSVLKLHPFHGSRHCIYFLPLLAVLVSAGLDFVIVSLWHLYSRRSMEDSMTLEARKVMFEKAGLLLLALLVVPILFHYGKYDFLRNYSHARDNEFPLKKTEYHQALDYITKMADLSDIILATRQTVDQLLFTEGCESMTPVKGSFAKVRYKGLDIFFSRDYWLFEEKKQIAEVLIASVKYKPVRKETRIWIVNIGYGRKPLMESFQSLMEGRKVRPQIYFRDYTEILSLPPEPILQAAKASLLNP